MKINELKAGDHVQIVNWHGRIEAIGEVERTTATQVIVSVNYSFQGGTDKSIKKFRRNTGKYGYGAGVQMGYITCPDHLGRLATDTEWEIHLQKCREGIRARTNYQRQETEREATRNRLNALLPDGVYVEVNRAQDEFSINITALVSETEVMEIVKRLKHYRPAKKGA
jgi:hypothetical protein